jgi:dTDP-4-dehydrorhamnose 3,5-epimerase
VDISSVLNLEIQGCWLFTPRSFTDDRGTFFEWFQDSTFGEHNESAFELAQANCSISNKGVIRGIHFANVPPGQVKYVTCLAGSVFDVVVDLRKGSPTFGKWNSVVLDSRKPSALYIPSGIGHAFMSLEDNSTFVYLCDQRYNPANEYDINPLDPTLNIIWPTELIPVMSPKDLAAPSFLEIQDQLPFFKG